MANSYDEKHQRKVEERVRTLGARPKLSWRQTALNLAFDIADYRSEDPYTQVGGCAIRHEGTIALGYNGPPCNINVNWRDRAGKNQRVIHAEANVLNYLVPGEAEFLAVTHLPCNECMKVIAQKKIFLVIYCIVIPKYDPETTFERAREFGIEMIQMNPTTKNAPSTLEYK